MHGIHSQHLGCKKHMREMVDYVLFLTMDEEENCHLKVNESYSLCKGELWSCQYRVTNNHWVLE
jgi:hypothetical protein